MAEIIEIKDITSPELDMFRQQHEPQLRHFYEPAPGLFLAESPKVIERALNGGYEPVAMLCERTDISGEAAALIAGIGNIPIFTAHGDIICSVTGFKLIRGALCAFRRKKLPTPEEICERSRRIAVLEGIVNPTNVGAVFRSAAALNMDAVLLTANCSDPLYRRSSRVSMGTVFQVLWTYMDSKLTDLKLLKNMGFAAASMALVEDSVDIDDPKLNSEEKLAVILGAEGDGLSPKTIADSDFTICIPMSHDVDSLNVAAASAVAFYQLGRKNKGVLL